MQILEPFENTDHRNQYISRASDHFQRNAFVYDSGIFAGETVNACFWLTLAAGLARSTWQINTQALPGLAASVDLLQQAREALVSYPKENVRFSPRGLFAERLRRYMWAGGTAVLLRPDMQARLFPAFAALDCARNSRQVHDYMH